MELNDWFNKGILPDDYIESMQTHRENLLHIYDNFQLPEDQAFIDALKRRICV